MESIRFYKTEASGNDFVLIEPKKFFSNTQLKKIAKKICERIYSVGADGLLLLERYKSSSVKMRIFNADGTEAEMCGNGARCAALYASKFLKNKKQNITIETKAGKITSEVRNDNVRIKLTSPRAVKFDIPVNVNGRIIKVNFINTGVPHTVIFVENLENIDVVNIGRNVRYHKTFEPYGTNVNFVEVLGEDMIKIRTYERGVENETLACGTGGTAGAIITNCKLQNYGIRKINVLTKSGETLKVYFGREKDEFNNVWLEGKARIVYKGEISL